MGSRHKKRKLKKIPKILFLSFLIVTILSVTLIYLNDKGILKKEVVNVQEIQKKKKKESKDYEAKIFMVGDALIHWGVYNDAKQSDGSYNFKPQLEYIKPISSKYDLAYYNQETILGGAALGYSSYPRFNSPQEVGDAFIDAGFNMVSLATNHTMDKGEAGVLNSVEYWKNHPEVAASGQWASDAERSEGVSKIYEKNNIKYAFISYTIWTNGLETPTGKEYLNNVYSPEKAKSDIELVRDKVDFVIVAMHWGTEYSMEVNSTQSSLAQRLADAGADVIIGNHVHVIEPFEWIGDSVCFYAMGNLLSSQIDVENRIGMMAGLDLVKTDDGVKIENLRADLHYTYLEGEYPDLRTNIQVYPFSQLNDSILPDHERIYAEFQRVMTSLDNNIQIGGV